MCSCVLFIREDAASPLLAIPSLLKEGLVGLTKGQFILHSLHVVYSLQMDYTDCSEVLPIVLCRLVDSALPAKMHKTIIFSQSTLRPWYKGEH